MKYLSFMFVAIAFLASGAQAAWLTEELPIGKTGSLATVSVSSSTLTKLPATSSLSGRSGIIVNAPYTNTGYIVGHYGNCTSAPGASSVQVIEIAASQADRLFTIDNGTCLWVITTNTTASENVHVQEVGQ